MAQFCGTLFLFCLFCEKEQEEAADKLRSRRIKEEEDCPTCVSVFLGRTFFCC